jgi:hypothetical protein
MISINLVVRKSDVLNEVSLTAEYTGQKMTGDDNAYGRIRTTDEDADALDRFWLEACSDATDTFKRFVTLVNTTPDYVVAMSVSSSYDVNLTSGMQDSLRSFFVNSIMSKWNQYTNKGEVDLYAQNALMYMKDVEAKLYFKKRPQRVSPS